MEEWRQFLGMRNMKITSPWSPVVNRFHKYAESLILKICGGTNVASFFVYCGN